MSLLYNKKLIRLAKNLRKNATRQEKHLWYDFLRHYPVRFQRQKTIGGYIVDFYCHKAKFIIELDGSQHYEAAGIASDKKRDAVLKNSGLEILRFSNIDIDRHFDGVCAAIDEYVKNSCSK